MSNRDKFLLVIIGIAGVILLPYFLYIKDARDRIVNLDNEIVQLEARYQELLEYEKNREMYEEGIVEYTRLRDEIIAKYPADIQQASTVMYLLNMEYSEAIVFSNLDEDEEVGDDIEELVSIEPTIRITKGKFNGSVKTPINSSLINPGEEQASSAIVETDFAALTNSSEFAFSCADPEAINHLLEYIRDDEDYPMIYRKIKFKYSMETGRVEGSMSLEQYAVLGGEDRVFEPIPVEPEITDEFRGNEEYGVFGPCKYDLYLEYLASLEEDNDEVFAEVDEEEDED